MGWWASRSSLDADLAGRLRDEILTAMIELQLRDGVPLGGRGEMIGGLFADGSRSVGRSVAARRNAHSRSKENMRVVSAFWRFPPDSRRGGARDFPAGTRPSVASAPH